MDKIFLSQANQQTASPHPTNNFLSPSPPSHPLSFTSHVSPNILLIIIILAIIFFISGLLHLLVRFLLRPSDRDQFDDVDNNNNHLTALQGQLQQLFHLHDCGVDQSFIDTLPVFKYEDVVISGNKKSPFDCAVCLSEFEGEDKLRLLPKCSHAFHMECIDTWLLSHSTCPLCRFNLVSDFSPNHSRSPIVLVLESGSDNSSREIILEREMNHGSTRIAISPKSCDNEAKDEEIAEKNTISKEKVVTIKLGKYRNVDGGGEGSSESNVNERRCFSMGSFAYIVDDNTSLQVPIRTPMKKPSVKKTILPLTPGHRAAMSECGYDSRRDFYMLESFKSVSEKNEIGNNGKGSKRESFSVSKIWMRGKKERGSSTVGGSSRRAFSFRFPVHGNGEELKGESGEIGNRGTISEIDFGSWDNGNCSELGFDEESQRGNNRFDSQPNAPSFARRTLLWLVGRQNKVVHSSFPPNS